MPYPELYNALESKAVDAQETPVGLIEASKFYEVQKYLTLTGHIYTPYILLASKKWFSSLSEADKKLVREAAQESAVYQRKLSRDAADNIAPQSTQEARDGCRDAAGRRAGQTARNGQAGSREIY
jgi:TRAP-type C4-dicarboxylate transport system substrate-binding protein